MAVASCHCPAALLPLQGYKEPCQLADSLRSGSALLYHHIALRYIFSGLLDLIEFLLVPPVFLPPPTLSNLFPLYGGGPPSWSILSRISYSSCNTPIPTLRRLSSMSAVTRDVRFSMSVLLADEKPTVAPRPRASYGRQFERRIVRVWKFVTRTTRKQPRNSIISPDFIVLTSRRRSTMIQPHLYCYQQ